MTAPSTSLDTLVPPSTPASDLATQLGAPAGVPLSDAGLEQQREYLRVDGILTPPAAEPVESAQSALLNATEMVPPSAFPEGVIGDITADPVVGSIAGDAGEIVGQAEVGEPRVTITHEAVRRIRELTLRFPAPDQALAAQIRGLLPELGS